MLQLLASGQEYRDRPIPLAALGKTLFSSATLMRDDAGQVIGAVAVLRDDDLPAWSLATPAPRYRFDDIIGASPALREARQRAETAAVIGVAMEAGIILFGDGPGTLRLLEEIGQGTPLGRILGNGAASVGKAYGVTRVPVVKGQGIPAYDPRAVKGIGVTYATSTMGADHTAGYAVATNILKVGGFVDPLKDDGQVELSRNLQIATAAIDSTGLCLFVAFPALDIPETLAAIIDMLNAKYRLSLTGDDVVGLGKSVLKTEHAFNIAAGFTKQDDRLPEFFAEAPCPPHQVTWTMSDEEIDKFWNF